MDKKKAETFVKGLEKAATFAEEVLGNKKYAAALDMLSNQVEKDAMGADMEELDLDEILGPPEEEVEAVP